jgi:molybdate-binding protein/transcriptional regulator with XRE-family HTH domain
MLLNDLRRIRTELSWSQDELARRAGLSRAGISAIETGRLVPSTAAALALAAALGRPVEELFRLARSAPESSEPIWAASGVIGPCRYWSAEVDGRLVVYPVEESPLGLLPHDGLYRAGAFHDHGAHPPDRTLVIAGCDPAAGLLAAAIAANGPGIRVVILPRSSQAAIELLCRGFVHAAGIHLQCDGDPSGNDRALATHPAPRESSYHMLNVAAWDEGIAISRGRKIRQVSAAVNARLRWIGREPGSGARQCFDDLVREFGSARALRPSLQARNHRGVAEAIRSGWADAGICVRLVSDEAGLEFLPVRREYYEFCFPETFAEDPRLRALVDAVRSRSYRQLLAELPGYHTERTGQTRRIPTGVAPPADRQTSAH